MGLAHAYKIKRFRQTDMFQLHHIVHALPMISNGHGVYHIIDWVYKNSGEGMVIRYEFV